MSKPLDEPPKFLELFPMQDFIIAAAFMLMNVILFLIIVNIIGFFLSLLITASMSYSVFWFFIFKNKMPRGFFDFVFSFISRPRLLMPGRENSELPKQ